MQDSNQINQDSHPLAAAVQRTVIAEGLEMPSPVTVSLSSSQDEDAPPIHVRIPASAEYVRVVREVVDCICKLRCLDEETRAAVKLAVGEAVNNAVSYGRHAHIDPAVDVSIWLNQNLLEIQVSNDSGDFHPDAPSKMPDAELLAESGRGLALMNLMMDEVEYFSKDGKTVAQLRKWLPES